VTLSDDNPTKPVKVQYTMYVVVQLKPKAVNITISEVKKPVVIPKSALKQLEANYHILNKYERKSDRKILKATLVGC
jgi:hypothetical protein